MRDIDTLVGADGDGGQSVEHIVASGQVEFDTHRRAVSRALQSEVRAQAIENDVTGAIVDTFGEAIGQHRPRHLWQHGAQHRIIGTEDGESIEGQVV